MLYAVILYSMECVCCVISYFTSPSFTTSIWHHRCCWRQSTEETWRWNKHWFVC